MQENNAALTPFAIYLYCVLGILISIVLPILRALLPRPAPGDADSTRSLVSEFWVQARPYLAVGLFSLLTGLLIVALTWETLADWRAALLAGYAWDSTLQKLTKN